MALRLNNTPATPIQKKYGREQQVVIYINRFHFI